MKARYIPNTIVSKGSQAAGWLFGDPVIRYEGSGMGGWTKENSKSERQKGGGWLADLYGGAQSGDDWAALYIPVNELPVTQLTSMGWSWYQSATETMGLGIVIWVHDPDDFDKRAEISQVGGAAGLDKSAGWNSHEFDSSVTQMFYYGENCTASALTAGTQYTWAEFQADTLFKNFVVYRISFDWGWEASGTFEDAWLAEVKLNGMYIPLKPQLGDRIGWETKQIHAATPNPSSTKATTITPTSGHRVRILAVFANTASSTASQFEVYFHTGANITTDATKAIFCQTLDADTIPSAMVMFGDHGPVGTVDEVVSTRTSVDITTNGNFTIVYKEE